MSNTDKIDFKPTPLMLQILVRAQMNPIGPHDLEGRPQWVDPMRTLQTAGLLDVIDGYPVPYFRTSARGEHWLDAMLETPVPHLEPETAPVSQEMAKLGLLEVDKGGGFNGSHAEGLAAMARAYRAMELQRMRENPGWAPAGGYARRRRGDL